MSERHTQTSTTSDLDDKALGPETLKNGAADEDTSQPWDLDAEWEAARAATEQGRNDASSSPPENGAQSPAEISVYALLYTGFLLGPPASLLAVIILMGRRFRVRTFAFALGVCGASWCAAQGATLGLRASWTPEALQMLRTLLNFGTGVILLGFAMTRTEIVVVHNRKIWLNTAGFFLLLLIISFSLAPETLYWLGR